MAIIYVTERKPFHASLERRGYQIVVDPVNAVKYLNSPTCLEKRIKK